MNYLDPPRKDDMTLLPVLKPVISSPLAGFGGGGAYAPLDFLPPALRVGGFAVGTSRLFGSYSGPLIRLRRDSDSVEQDVGSGASRVSSDAVTGLCGKNLLRYSAADAAYYTLNGAIAKTNLGLSGEVNNFQGMSVTGGGASWHKALTLGFPVVAGITYTLTLWYKAGTSGKALLSIQTPGASWLQGNVGELSIANSSTVSWEIISQTLVGSTYSIEVKFTPNYTATTYLGFGPFSSNSGETVVWLGAQLEYGSAATTYEARTTTGASPCLVSKLYDQIGANNALQTTGTMQPQIIPRQIGEWPILVGDGVDDRLLCSGVLTGCNAKDLTLIMAGRNAIAGNPAAPRLYVDLATSSYNDLQNLAHGNTGSRRVISLVAANLSQTMYVNGVSAATATSAQVATWTNPDLYLGRVGGTAYANPGQSTILLPSALSPADRAAIEAKLMTEYSIT